ncbi:MAG: MGT family glycosyltransferase [Lachnospiraceae bacterium]|nr:MGT family glycosyltransferase [Lachnospiraceae bacterium]
MEKNTVRTVLVYGIPAYGHLYAGLFLAGRLSKRGVRVVYYSTEVFRREIEANGCAFRAYPFRQEELDLRDGARLLRLYRVILEFTDAMLFDLLKEAEALQPQAVVFDSLALWGRAVSGRLCIPGYALYHIAAIRRPFDAGFFSYAENFLNGFFADAAELVPALWARGRLKRRYRLGQLGLLPVLMNQGTRNLAVYSRRFQPGGRLFGKKWLFLGPLSIHRKALTEADRTLPCGPLIYVSLGTIFNRNADLLHALVKAFGSGSMPVVLVWDMAEAGQIRLPSNFTVRRFVDQRAVLKRAALFITAGGLNSIHEALYYGVPCLFCPQQGEQAINARRFERLGFGKILCEPGRLREEAKEAFSLPLRWDEEIRKKLVQIRTERVLRLLGGGPKGEGKRRRLAGAQGPASCGQRTGRGGYGQGQKNGGI